MYKYQLALVLIVFSITAGCQQSYISTTSNKAVKPLTTPAKQDQTIVSNQSIAKPSTQAAIEPTETNETSVITESTLKSSDKKAEDSNIIAQEKIDQALELCNYAQQMWEKGKLEEALTNLDSAYFTILELDSDVAPEFNQQKEDIRYLISKRILEIYASRQIAVNGQHNEIPHTINNYVQKEIKRLTGPERKFLIQSMERAQRYRPFILAELKKAGLPEDLAWLPLIESGFKTRALSSARALGLWQFIPSTGYKFGLSRNYYIDERLDPQKATLAAIAYLKELHNLFGDWTTALAAYNCGESRVLRIIRKQRINYLDNFWDLYQSLPRETSRYVPRFLATLHIINNLEKYNIKINNPQKPIAFKTFEVKKQVRLKDIAKGIGVSEKLLKELNVELRYALLPPETYQLKIPEEKAELFLSRIDKIKTTYSPPPMYVYHRVRKGQTLSGIARKYKTSASAISQVNNIRKSRIYAGKVLKIPSRANGTNTRVSASQSVKNIKTGKYTVRRGDNLWNIARKFNTTTKNLTTINKLSSNMLHVGQTLYLTSKKQTITANANASTHKVRSGDSPFIIAKKYKMDLNRFLVLNHLTKRSKIFPGQKLIVE